MRPALSSDYFRLALLTTNTNAAAISRYGVCVQTLRASGGGFRRLTGSLCGNPGEAQGGASHHIAVMRKVYYPIGQALVLSPVDSRTW